MIRLFVTDLDGCIATPFETPDWEAITEIRALNQASRTDSTIPQLTLCTGRPFPYAEAVAQWLDVKIPFIFESAALYDWDANRVETLFDGQREMLRPVERFKQWLSEVLLPQYPGTMPEFAKMMDAGVVCPDPALNLKIHSVIQDKVAAEYPELEVHYTEVSVNVLMAGQSKVRGIELLEKKLGIDRSQMAFIGDSTGDISAMKAVSKPFAPLNALEEVKVHASVVNFETTRAVLEAYHSLIRENRG